MNNCSTLVTHDLGSVSLNAHVKTRRFGADGRTVNATADGRTFGVLHSVRGGSAPPATRSAPAPAVNDRAGSAAVAYLKNRPVVQGFWRSVKLGAPATA